MELKDVGAIAITFLVIAILIGIGAEILNGIGENAGGETVLTITNETSSNVNQTGVSQVNYTLRGTPINTIYRITNSNHTVGTQYVDWNITDKDYGLITIYNGTGNWMNESEAYVNTTYSYNVKGGSVYYNATMYGGEGLEELASWLPTIAIIVAAAVIIGIIVAYFIFQ